MGFWRLRRRNGCSKQRRRIWQWVPSTERLLFWNGFWVSECFLVFLSCFDYLVAIFFIFFYFWVKEEQVSVLLFVRWNRLVVSVLVVRPWTWILIFHCLGAAESFFFLSIEHGECTVFVVILVGYKMMLIFVIVNAWDRFIMWPPVTLRLGSPCEILL